jgi:hypothetical protein
MFSLSVSWNRCPCSSSSSRHELANSKKTTMRGGCSRLSSLYGRRATGGMHAWIDPYTTQYTYNAQDVAGCQIRIPPISSNTMKETKYTSLFFLAFRKRSWRPTATTYGYYWKAPIRMDTTGTLLYMTQQLRLSAAANGS